ncbi:MAG: hypothetical protein JXB48_21780 [Candidatus Latescibacteria bacterium]|nr:hypothetical protein [Candidatus Latescibacterota bacterium]
MNGSIKQNMHLLILVLFDNALLDDIILGLTSISGGRVTMVDGVSGTANLSEAIPMFAEFLNMGGRQFCKVLCTCVEDTNPIKHLLDILNTAGIDFQENISGEIYDIPLSGAIVLEE